MKKHHREMLEKLEGFLAETPTKELEKIFNEIEEMHLPEDEPAVLYLERKIKECPRKKFTTRQMSFPDYTLKLLQNVPLINPSMKLQCA